MPIPVSLQFLSSVCILGNWGFWRVEAPLESLALIETEAVMIQLSQCQVIFLLVCVVTTLSL